MTKKVVVASPPTTKIAEAEGTPMTSLEKTSPVIIPTGDEIPTAPPMPIISDTKVKPIKLMDFAAMPSLQGWGEWADTSTGEDKSSSSSSDIARAQGKTVDPGLPPNDGKIAEGHPSPITTNNPAFSLEEKLHQAKLEVEIGNQLPAIKKLEKNPTATATRMKKLVKEHLKKFCAIKHLEMRDLKETDLLLCLAIFAKNRGRCTYQTGEKGISPATARKYTSLLRKVLKERFKDLFDDLWPNFRFIPSYWARDLSREKLYQRQYADYWSTDKLKDCLEVCSQVQTEKIGSAMAHYAKMALPVLAIAITQAGCRVGELLEARPQQVVIGQVDGKIAIAIFATGAKMDPDNQKSAPISFMQLEDQDICPVKWFMQWLKFRQFVYSDQGLQGQDKYVFPNFSSHGTMRVQTSQFTKQVSSGKNFTCLLCHSSLCVTDRHRDRIDFDENFELKCTVSINEHRV